MGIPSDKAIWEAESYNLKLLHITIGDLIDQQAVVLSDKGTDKPQIVMLGKLPYNILEEGVFAHPTLAESLNNLFGSFQD